MLEEISQHESERAGTEYLEYGFLMLMG